MTNPRKEDLVQYRIIKAKDTLNEVDVQIQNGFWNVAINRLYYACFYAVLALLTQYDMKTKTHSGARQMLGLHFIKPGIISEKSGDFYTDIFTLRHSSDYDDFIIFEKDEVSDLLPLARTLIAEVEQILAKR